MPDQDRFSDHAAKLAGLRQPHHSDDQMQQTNEEVAHSDNRNKVRQPSDFTPTLGFARDITQNEVAWFGADKWTPFQRMTIDLGLRFDYDSITHATNTAPRAGFALALTRDARTLLKSGVGLFYDRVPLNTASFTLLPARAVQTLSPSKEILNSTTYVNTVSGTLRNPRSVGWHVELDRQITSRLLMRARKERTMITTSS